jgi:glutaredoxin
MARRDGGDGRGVNSNARRLAGLLIVVAAGFAVVQGVGWWSRERLGAQVAAAARPGDIRMIGSVTCVYCAAARAWFTENRVPFSECLIEHDAACADTYRALLAPGTPMLLVRGRRLVGFDAQRVADALAANPSPPTP